MVYRESLNTPRHIFRSSSAVLALYVLTLCDDNDDAVLEYVDRCGVSLCESGEQRWG